MRNTNQQITLNYLHDNPEWNDPANKEARKAFLEAIRTHRYSDGMTIKAWLWFLIGWENSTAEEQRRSTGET